MAFIMTRIDVGDYDAWKQAFDQDLPRAREQATSYRVFRGLENRGEVFIQLEFPSSAEAEQARARLLASGVLERFADRNGPTVVEQTELITR